jgi:hypothetical protein
METGRSKTSSAPPARPKTLIAADGGVLVDVEGLVLGEVDGADEGAGGFSALVVDGDGGEEAAADEGVCGLERRSR